MKAICQARTVTLAVPILPFFPSVAAVIVIGPPVETAVTMPVGDTVATVELLVAHVTATPGTMSPLPSRAVAESWTVPPTGIVIAAGDTLIETTAPGAPFPNVG